MMDKIKGIPIKKSILILRELTERLLPNKWQS